MRRSEPAGPRLQLGCAIALSAVGLALAVRLLGVRLGLPYSHHWDEIWVVGNVQKMLRTEDWEPATYQYGAPLSAIAAWMFRSLTEIFPKRHIDPGDAVLLRLLCRLVTAVISSSGAAAVYVAARYALPGDRGGRMRGAYAALLYATAAELVTHGRYGVTDADLVAWVAWALAACALFLRSGSPLWASATVAFAAVAFSFKITAATALVIPALALALRAVAIPRIRTPAAGRAFALLALPSCAAVFVLLNPHVVIHWSTALKNITSRARQTMEGGFPQFLLRRPGWDHVQAVLSGIVLMAFHRWAVPAVAAAIAGFAGLARALRARSGVARVGSAHAAVAILALALTSRAYLFRNYLVALPILCVGFGFAMQTLTAAGARRGWRATGPCLAAAFGLIYVAVPFGQAVRAQQMSLDARTRAIDWIASRTGGRQVTVACTPAIVSQGGYDEQDLRQWLKRPGLAFRSDVKDSREAQRSHADYVVVVSRPDPDGDWGDLWPFRDVPGYRSVAQFDASPYEHRFDITASWAGRFNVIVLERLDDRGPRHGA